MAIDFPNTPALNDEYTVGTTVWKYDGSKWQFKSVTASPSSLSDSTPLVESGSGSAGTAGTASRSDHVHPAAGGGDYLLASSASTIYAPLASPTFTGTVTSPAFNTSIADTATSATHYFVETASDGTIRPKTLANARTEIVTTSAVNSASATTLGTITLGTWNASTITATYIDTAIARLASPTFTGTITLPLTTAGLVTTTSGGVISSSSYPRANADMMGYTATVTAGGTTTLNNTSTQYQLFTGSANQTVVLPVTSTLVTGWTFHLVNNSSGTLTVNSSGGNLVVSVPANMTSMVTCIGTTLTTAADWEYGYTDFGSVTGTGSAVLSNSPTFTGSVLGVEDTIPYSKTGTLTVSTGTIRYRFPWAATILGVTAAVNTAPTGASLICDVNKNGTTIFTTQANRPTIAASGTATTTEPTPDVTSIAAGDYLTVDIDQIGSTIAGSDLTVIVRYKRA